MPAAIRMGMFVTNGARRMQVALEVGFNRLARVAARPNDHLDIPFPKDFDSAATHASTMRLA